VLIFVLFVPAYFVRGTSLCDKQITSKIGAAMIQIVTNVEFIKTFIGTDEAIRTRQREQYRAYDLSVEIIQMKHIISFGNMALKLFINTYVFLLGISSIIHGQMTWGQLGAFQSFLHGIQDKWTATFQLTVSYRKSIGVARNLVEMLRTPVVIEKEQRGEEYRTERPRFDEMPGMLGTDMSQTIRSVNLMRKGITQWSAPQSCTWYELRKLGVPWKRTSTGDLQLDQALLSSMPPFPKPCSITFDKVCFYYPEFEPNKDRPSAYTLPRKEKLGILNILDNVSFHIPASTVVALSGPNGCGKSTSAKLMERSYDPQSGVVLIGKTITRVFFFCIVVSPRTPSLCLESLCLKSRSDRAFGCRCGKATLLRNKATSRSDTKTAHHANTRTNRWTRHSSDSRCANAQDQTRLDASKTALVYGHHLFQYFLWRRRRPGS
jgi:ABC-type multidrug transport system fused ATPase/permease subunit